MRFRSTVLVAFLLSGCDGDGHLRGHLTDSVDGKTYLVIADDQDDCPIKVDGQDWNAPAGTPKPIAPEKHVIECLGGEISFMIPERASEKRGQIYFSC